MANQIKELTFHRSQTWPFSFNGERVQGVRNSYYKLFYNKNIIDSNIQ